MDLKRILKKLKSSERKPQISVVGDVGIDRYYSGEVTRISPEAPVPVLLHNHTETVLGMAANVAGNIYSLSLCWVNGNCPNTKIYLAGAIGNDSAGSEIVDQIDYCVDERLLYIESIKETTVKTRFMCGQHQLLRMDHEVTRPLELPKHINLVMFEDREAFKKSNVVVLQDYAKGFFGSLKLTNHIKKLAKANGSIIIADPCSRSNPLNYVGVDILVPNISEAEALLKRKISTLERPDEEAERACQDLIKKFKLNAVVLKRSDKGLTYMKKGEAAVHVPCQSKKVVDVTGAGDTVIAAIAVGLAHGLTLGEACVLANAAAAVAVSKIGTSIVYLSEIKTG